MTTTTKKEQAAKWMRIWFAEATLAEKAGEWQKAQRCKANARIWAGRAAKF
jgi:hypothetical protein